MARQDKNKRGASGRGGRLQKTTRGRQRTGAWPSDPASPGQTNTASREPEHHTRSLNSNARRFNLLVDSVPYIVSATPFRFNGEVRYQVSFNGNSEHVFTWDSSLGQLRAIDDDASTLPDNLEQAISEKLQSKA